MASRIKHITSRFWIHIIVSTLLLILLLVFALSASYFKKEVIRIAEVNDNITSKLEILQYNYEKSLLLQKSDPAFVSTTCDKIILEQKQLIKSITDTIEKISNLPYIKFSVEKSSLDTLYLFFDNYSIAFEKTLLSLKEMGNYNQGLAVSIIAPSNQLSDVLFRNTLLSQKSSELKQKTNSFLLSLNAESLVVLEQFCQDLKDQIILEGIDPSQFDAPIYDLQKSLSDIKEVETRLFDPATNKGQLFDLNFFYNQTNHSYKRLSFIINKNIKNVLFYWNFWLIFFAIILIAVNFSLLFRFSRKLARQLKSLLNSTIQLSKGSLEVEFSTNAAYEFNELNLHLSTFKTHLTEKKNFVDKLLSKEFDREIELLSDKDELGAKLIALKEQMLSAKKEQEIHNKETESNRYINEGLAKFADIMRQNNNNTVALGDSLIRALVKHIEVQQGSIFLTDEENENRLNLISAFAFDRKKYLTKTIQKGEGLVGTCAVEKNTINLIEVPEEYISIKSGLGDTPPRNILIVPVMHELTLVGVVELASLKILNNYEIELTEQICASLASTIITVRNNTKTAQLLEKSQQQAAEMAEQEEEMRQNMEELKATQEESARREEELIGIIEAIGTSFFVIEYNTDGTISHINERLGRFLNQPVDSIINRKHQEVFSTKSVINSDLFSDLYKNRKSINITETLYWGNREYLYKHSISPVLNKYSEVLKIINLLTIEEKKPNN